MPNCRTSPEQYQHGDSVVTMLSSLLAGWIVFTCSRVACSRRTPVGDDHENGIYGSHRAWALPLLGHILSLLRSPLRFLTSLSAHGHLVRIRIGPIEGIVVCTSELVRHVLFNDRIFDRDGPFFDRNREAFGDGLATCPHRLHRRQRRLAQPAFHTARLPGYAQVMPKHIDEVTGSWQDSQILDVLSEMMTLTARRLIHKLH